MQGCQRVGGSAPGIDVMRRTRNRFCTVAFFVHLFFYSYGGAHRYPHVFHRVRSKSSSCTDGGLSAASPASRQLRARPSWPCRARKRLSSGLHAARLFRCLRVVAGPFAKAGVVTGLAFCDGCLWIPVSDLDLAKGPSSMHRRCHEGEGHKFGACVRRGMVWLRASESTSRGRLAWCPWCHLPGPSMPSVCALPRTRPRSSVCTSLHARIIRRARRTPARCQCSSIPGFPSGIAPFSIRHGCAGPGAPLLKVCFFFSCPTLSCSGTPPAYRLNDQSLLGSDSACNCRL